MPPSPDFIFSWYRHSRRWGLALALCLLLAGCATLSRQTGAPPVSPQVWSGPQEFSADYLWNARRAAVAYDRPVKLVRLVVRRGRAVRAVGIDVFGTTLVDELIRTDPLGKTHTRFRQGAENVDGLLLEQIIRLVFFNEPASARVRWQKNEAGKAGSPAALLGVQIDGDEVEMDLLGATIVTQQDSDFDFPAAP